jgi:uncharacterized protein YndB with AHSA1/START domain
MDLLNVTHETVIPAGPAEVWALISDLEAHPRLAGSGEVQRVTRIDEGPLREGLGFTVDEVVLVGPKQFDLSVTSHVTSVVPDRLLAWETDSPTEFGKPTVRLIAWTYELAETPEGTRLRHTLRIVMTSSWVTPFFRPVYSLIRGKKVRRGMAETLRRISAEVTQPSLAP